MSEQPVPTGHAPRRWMRGTRVQRRVTSGLAAAILLGALAYAAYLSFYGTAHVATDDAFIEARVAPVSARLRGTVIKVLVADNQDVAAGRVLVRLDPRDWQVNLERARAAVLLARSRLRGAAASVPLTDESTRSQVAQAEASVGSARLGIEGAQRALQEKAGKLRARLAAVQSARADIAARHADFERARLDHARMDALLRGELVARQNFDHADAALKTARATLDAAQQRLDMALAEVSQVEAEVGSQEVARAQARRGLEEAEAARATARSRRREVAIRQADNAGAEAQLAEALANLREAELNVEYTTIQAPIAGRVTKKTVEVGQVVQPGQPLLAVVSVDDVWVVANYKETQLTDVLPGQPATVRVDTFPELVLRARVDSIQRGTGSRFSLLPPENASGNFVKVVQRIPVKLVLEPGQDGRRLLVPGMSVVPTIQVR